MVNPDEIVLFLIEDDDVDAEGVERAFIENKIANKIVRARDGVEAFKILDSGILQHYIILLDLNMPGMGGIEFLQKLRKNDKYSKAVVFVLTTSNSDKDILSSYKEHISGYFVKGEMGSDFFHIAKLFDGYWKIVKLP